MSNGNLHGWLHPVKGDNNVVEWSLRVKISVDIAKGLALLHRRWKFQVVHHSNMTNCRKTISSSSSSSIHKILEELFDHLLNSIFPFILNDIIDKSLIGKGFKGEILQFHRIASDYVQPLPN
ncbi:hypothetical protein FEM48_Zijuj05G0181300 [Ziziphus jujuba var. spinosa]|uniref:Uncharacterized protein n=1 Tax=Ziziphus jujuba var. spinosa TaxID=714518 RepID=A0A978VGC2_ZIZJJ|nr:hypothetical protein FEM48_Zijuj05G0181300 [Ziziphus jujuba var. spinosa]